MLDELLKRTSHPIERKTRTDLDWLAANTDLAAAGDGSWRDILVRGTIDRAHELEDVLRDCSMKQEQLLVARQRAAAIGVTISSAVDHLKEAGS